MSLKAKYNFLHLFYWFTGCCINGFIAVFLQSKGLSNTEIGIVTGGSCVATIFLSPFMSSLISKIKGMTIKKLMTFLMLTTVLLYIAMAFLPIPAFLVMIFYVIMYALNMSTVPMLTMIAMNYINEGIYVNFGLARGIGSASWATSALIFGQAVSFLGANILSIAYCVFALVTLFILYHLPESKITKTKTEEVQEEGSVVTVIKKYKIFFFLLLGFCFMFSGATAIGTYLINIVKSLGGNTSLYGVAMFAMAFSELPVMMTVPKLMKKFNSVTLILVASIFYICRNYTIGLAPNLIVLIIGMMFQGLSYGLFTGVITYYVTYNLDTQDQMSGQTMIGIMTSGIGSTLGNVLGGILQDTIGLNALFTFVYLMTALGAVIIFICKFVSIKVKKITCFYLKTLILSRC